MPIPSAGSFVLSGDSIVSPSRTVSSCLILYGGNGGGQLDSRSLQGEGPSVLAGA